MDGEAQVEFGYDVRRDYWGRGLATEAAGAARAYALRGLGLPGLVSMIRHGNHASCRVAEKIGMRLQKEIERYGQGYWLYGLSGEDTEEKSAVVAWLLRPGEPQEWAILPMYESTARGMLGSSRAAFWVMSTPVWFERVVVSGQ